MAKKPSGPAYEKKKAKQRDLERQVLQHLKKYPRPHNWDSLFVLFDVRRTAAIEPVLQDLKQSG